MDVAPPRVTRGNNPQLSSKGKVGEATKRKRKPAAKLIPNTRSRLVEGQMPMYARATSAPSAM